MTINRPVTSMRIMRVLHVALLMMPVVIFGPARTSAQKAATPAKPAMRLESKLLSDSTIFTMKFDPKQKIEQGKTFEVKVHVTPGEHWHVYSSKSSPDVGSPLQFGVAPESAPFFELVNFREVGKLIDKYDSNLEANSKAYYQPFDIVATLKAKKDAKVGKAPVSVYAKYYTCSNSVCIPARAFEIPMKFLGQKPVEVSIAKGTFDSTSIGDATDTSSSVAGVAAVESAPPTTPNGKSDGAISAGSQNAAVGGGVVEIADRSIWEFILAAAGFGLLALLTPCVFPMVPITVSFFTKRNAGSRKEAVKDAVLYAGGIIVTFVGLGFLLSLLAGPAGINKFAANPWANLLIAAIFITFALNLFGLFEIGVPSSLLNKLNTTAQQSKSRTMSVALMGLVFSLTSFTCTVPFVGTLMVAFSKGSWFVPLIGMVVFSLVFSLPFFLLALFPSLMKSLPRSGGWLNSVKVVMGFLEIAASLKFFSNADLVWSWGFFSRDLVLATWVAIAILTTLYLLGRFQLSHDSPVGNISAIRVLLAVAFLSVGVYLWTGFHGRPLGQLDAFLPPGDANEAAFLPASTNSQDKTITRAASEKWFESYPEALAEAKRTGKNIFIDFTGYTCTNCRAMESTVFSKDEVREIFKDFVLARLYTDKDSPLNDSNRVMEEQRFNTIALPYYAIMSPDDKSLSTFPGFTRDVGAFKAFLTAHRAGTVERPAVAMIGAN